MRPRVHASEFIKFNKRRTEVIFKGITRRAVARSRARARRSAAAAAAVRDSGPPSVNAVIL